MENMLINARYQSSVIPGTIQANFTPLKEMIAQQMKSLDGIEATDENLKSVKETLAFLRKFKTGMKACLKDDINRYEKPVAEYKDSFNDMMLSVDESIEKFASQVDEIVRKQKEEKRKVVESFIILAVHDLLPEMVDFIHSCDWFFDEAWTNKTKSESSIKKEIEKKVSDVCAAYELLDDKGKYAPYMLNQYKATGDLMGCLEVRKSLQAQDEAYVGKEEPVANLLEVESEPEVVVRAPVSIGIPVFNYQVSMSVPEDFLELVRQYVTDNGFSFTILSKGVSL